jgi:hypothetical protein
MSASRIIILAVCARNTVNDDAITSRRTWQSTANELRKPRKINHAIHFKMSVKSTAGRGTPSWITCPRKKERKNTL